MEITNNVASLTPKKVSELRSSFFIPDYQRGYRWGRHNVRQLLNDIRDSKDMTVASLEMSDEPKIPLKGESFSDFIATFDMSVVFETYFDLQH